MSPQYSTCAYQRFPYAITPLEDLPLALRRFAFRSEKVDYAYGKIFSGKTQILSCVASCLLDTSGRIHLTVMTRVSRGCISCKARHLRCGREHPACRRCVKAGLVCIGAVPDHERFFVVSTSANYQCQDTASVGRSLVLANPRPSLATDSHSASISYLAKHSDSEWGSFSAREELSQTGFGPLCHSPSSNIEMLALGNYMSENGGYSATARDLLRPFDSFFKTEYASQASNHAAFKYASEALTLLDYCHKVRSETVKTRAIARYSLALRSVQGSIDAISSNVGRFKSLLDSIWIMVQVEAKLRSPSSAQNCRTHMKGIFDMIRQISPCAMQTYREKTNQARDLDGAKKLGASLDELILLSMQTKQAVPQLGSWIASVLENAGPPERLSLLASHIPALQVRAKGILNALQPRDDRRLHHLVQHAVALDQELLIWRHGLPIEWTTLISSESTGVRRIYSNLPVTMLVNQWRVWRMHIWLLVLRCVGDRRDHYGQDHILRAENNLRKLVEGIRDSADMYLHCVTGNPADSQADPDVPSLTIRLSKLLSLLLFARRVPCLPGYQDQWVRERIIMIQNWCSGDWRSVTPFAVESNFLNH